MLTKWPDCLLRAFLEYIGPEVELWLQLKFWQGHLAQDRKYVLMLTEMLLGCA